MKTQSSSLLSLNHQIPKESSAKNISSPSNEKMKSSKWFMGIKTSIANDGAGMFDSLYPNVAEKCILSSKDNLYTPNTTPLGLNHVFIIFFILRNRCIFALV